MTFLQRIQGQAECIWTSASSQANSFWEGIKGTARGCYNGIEFHTDQAARYAFGVDKRPIQQRNVVLNYVVAPLSVTLSVTTLFVSTRAACFLAVASAAYFLYVARKNQYC